MFKLPYYICSNSRIIITSLTLFPLRTPNHRSNKSQSHFPPRLDIQILDPTRDMQKHDRRSNIRIPPPVFHKRGIVDEIAQVSARIIRRSYIDSLSPQTKQLVRVVYFFDAACRSQKGLPTISSDFHLLQTSSTSKLGVNKSGAWYLSRQNSSPSKDSPASSLAI